MKHRITFLYLATLIALTIYSYSQIDLNLTLSSNSFYQNIQNTLILLGYFNRPLSTIIYIILLVFLSVSYFAILKKYKDFSKKVIWRLIIVSSFLLLFSYPAFSHDIFNYMFDARIFTKYGLNPYSYKALDFSGDLWIRFMHWTHRSYPYGPVWLILTIPFSFLGLQKFTLTLLLFKLLFLGAYLLNCYLIYQIVEKLDRQKALFSLSFFAFNPLILLETLASPHNDSLMLLFILLSVYLILKKKYIVSLLSMLVGVGIKFVSLPLLLVNFFVTIVKPKKIEVFVKKLLPIFLIIYFLSASFVIYFREILPWYGITFIGLAALFNNKFIRLLSGGLSFGLLLKYVSFLYQGEWLVSSYNTFVIVLLVLVFSLVVYYFASIKTNILKFK